MVPGLTHLVKCLWGEERLAAEDTKITEGEKEVLTTVYTDITDGNERRRWQIASDSYTCQSV